MSGNETGLLNVGGALIYCRDGSFRLKYKSYQVLYSNVKRGMHIDELVRRAAPPLLSMPGLIIRKTKNLNYNAKNI